MRRRKECWLSDINEGRWYSGGGGETRLVKLGGNGGRLGMYSELGLRVLTGLTGLLLLNGIGPD